MTEQEERVSDSIRKAAAKMGVSESDLRAYTEGLLEPLREAIPRALTAESRVQELEGERTEALDDLSRANREIALDNEAIDAYARERDWLQDKLQAAESRLARLENAIKKHRRENYRESNPDEALYAALTHSTPPRSDG